MFIILNATVARNMSEKAIAVCLSRFLLISMFTFPWYGESMFKVMRSIMAVMAVRRLTSHRPNGNIIVRFAPLLLCGILFLLFCFPHLFVVFQWLLVCL